MKRENYEAGAAPVILGKVPLGPLELLYVENLPLRMPDAPEWRLPKNLWHVFSLIPYVSRLMQHDRNLYVYLTAQHTFVPKSSIQRRPGWHADGFGSDDINVIWYDSTPTEFAVQDFPDGIDDHHELSMIDMDRQVREDCIRTYPTGTLLMIDERMIHRPAVQEEAGFRRFIKFTISRHKANMAGNAHNYLFEYAWEMTPRDIGKRNNPGTTYTTNKTVDHE